MKNVLVAIAAISLLLSSVSTASAKNLSISELKHYQPLKKYDYRILTNSPDKGKSVHTLYYEDNIWYNSKNLADTTYYSMEGNYFYMHVYGSYVGLKIKAPVKIGQITTHKDLDGRVRFKVVSTSKKIKTKSGTYKNVVVIKNLTYGSIVYVAKNRGVVLIEGTNSSSNIFEMIRVLK